MKTLLLVCLSGTLVFGGAAAADPNLLQETVVKTALEENPKVKAARAKWEMMKARVPQAIAWEDLRVGVDSVAGRFVNIPPNSFMNQTVTVEQELPVSGRNRSRARAATAEAGAAFEEFRRAELDVVSRARGSYSRLANGYAQLEVNRRNEELLGQFVKISETRYETGAATQSDVLIAQTDLAKLLETRADIQRQISEEQSALNVLMNRPAQAPLGQPAPLIFVAHDFSLERLQAMTLARRPEMQRAQSMIEAEKFRLELANRQWFPDPMLNFKAQRYNDASQVVSELDIGISIPLPWLNRKKYAAGIVESQKSLENARREFDATRAEALGMVRDQLKKIQTAASQYELYQNQILPLARQTVDASQAAYEASTGGFLELITARRTLQEVESMALTRLAEYEAAIAELEAITGNPDTPSKRKGYSKMNRITRRIVLASLVIAWAPSCSKQAANTGSERNPDEVAASQASAQASAPDSRKIKYYKSAMMAGETSKTPGKDSMGTDMVPVYEGAEDTSAPSVDAGKKTPGEAAPAQAVATGSRKVKYYKSGMMLGEISKTPRKDSMGMDMVPVYEGAEDTSVITVDPVTIQVMGVRTAKVRRGPLNRVIRTVGVIDYNETALADVTTKFRGWIEKLYVDSTGKEVHKGEPLFDIYSPDLYSAQNEYVLALAQGTPGLKASARLKLALFDISDDQIAEMERTRTPQRTLRINAPIEGIVVEKMAVQGQMVDAGMKLYRLADLSLVWVQAQVYEEDLAFLKLGQEVEVSLSYLPDRKFKGRITYIYPTVDEKTRTAHVRMEFHNPGLFLKPGMFATVQVRSELEPSALLVPDSAVLRSGEKNTVFVALDGGKFEPRVVTLGPRAENNMYQALSGLKEGEAVVTSAQFMLDSESQLREAIQKMLEPPKEGAPAPEHQHPVPKPDEAAMQITEAAPTSFVCPMPEHASIRYDHPGKCPICGMTLIPNTVSQKAESTAATPGPMAAPEEDSEHHH